MIINKVTISGADDKVSVRELVKLQEKYPFVEWGILISKKRMGTNRYPTLEWIKKLPYELDLSLHLCGEIVREFVNTPTSEILHYANGDHWSRTQLNFSFKEDKNYLPNLASISELASFMPDKAIVLAYNKGSKVTLDAFIKNAFVSMPYNIHFLYDSSGGRGTEIKYFQKPLISYTGYAGGISPDNVFQICDTLSNMEWEDNIWIDMESGVRTNDEFDLKKVEQVLLHCEKFVNIKAQ